MSDNEPMTLTEFLEARITEDERECRHMLELVPTPAASLENGWDHAYAERVLAECAAKRAIVNEHAEEMTHWWPEMVEVQVCGRCGDGASVEWPCPTIAALTAVYADHPEYDPEWSN